MKCIFKEWVITFTIHMYSPAESAHVLVWTGQYSARTTRRSTISNKMPCDPTLARADEVSISISCTVGCGDSSEEEGTFLYEIGVVLAPMDGLWSEAGGVIVGVWTVDDMWLVDVIFRELWVDIERAVRVGVGDVYFSVVRVVVDRIWEDCEGTTEALPVENWPTGEEGKTRMKRIKKREGREGVSEVVTMQFAVMDGRLFKTQAKENIRKRLTTSAHAQLLSIEGVSIRETVEGEIQLTFPCWPVVEPTQGSIRIRAEEVFQWLPTYLLWGINTHEAEDTILLLCHWNQNKKKHSGKLAVYYVLVARMYFDFYGWLLVA